MEFGLRKRRQGWGVAIVTGDSGSDASRCADKLWHLHCTCAVIFHRKSRADDHDVIRCSCYQGREVYKES